MNAHIDVTDVILETERLILRPWTMNDLDDFYEYASQSGVGEMAGWKAHESIDESRKILTMFMKEKKTFAIEYKDNHKVIGSLGIEVDRLKDDPEYQSLYGREIGYVLNKDYWGAGLMPEAVQCVIQYCFKQLHYVYLLCGYYNKNNKSRRVNEKCGFQFLKEVDFHTRMGTVEPGKLNIIKK